jgi:hypothetical protein
MVKSVSGRKTTHERTGYEQFHGDARSWDDLRVPLSSTKLGGSKDPTFSQVLNNGAGSQGVFAYLFSASQEKELYFGAQMPHNWEEGTAIHPHVHWLGGGNGGATDVCAWGLEYSLANIGELFPNTTLVYGNEIFNADPQIIAFEHQVTELPSIDMSGVTLSSMLICRIFRDATGAGLTDDYSDVAALVEVDFHYRINSMGSAQEYIKEPA